MGAREQKLPRKRRVEVAERVARRALREKRPITLNAALILDKEGTLMAASKPTHVTRLRPLDDYPKGIAPPCPKCGKDAWLVDGDLDGRRWLLCYVCKDPVTINLPTHPGAPLVSCDDDDA